MKHYTPNDDAVIRRLKAVGTPTKAIARALGTTNIRSVQNRAQKIKAASPRRQDARFDLYISSELRDDLAKEAHALGIPMNAYARMILERRSELTGPFF